MQEYTLMYIQDEFDQLTEDLEASVAFYDNLVSNKTPEQLANKYTNELNIKLSDGQLNKVLGMYATSTLSIEQCVDSVVF